MEITVGDRITLVGRATHQQMRQRTMAVAGIYDIGMSDLEKQNIYISLGEAQDLYGLSGQATEVVVSLKQLGQEAAVMSALKPALPGYEMASWQTNYPDLQAALDSKNGIMNIFSVIILIIAGIGILNLLLMAVYERTREIGLMGALGMRPGQISSLLINGVLGKVGMDYSQFTSLAQYMALITGRVYPTLGMEKLPQRALTILIIAVLASFYPAHEAAQNEPASALHYV